MQELKNVKEIKSARTALSMHDVVETNELGQIVHRQIPAPLLVKHYVIVFYLDLLETLIETSLEEKHDDKLKEFVKYTRKNLIEICGGSTLELVTNFVA